MTKTIWNVLTGCYTEAICPCNGCKERELSCHAECERYAEFKEKIEFIRNEAIKHSKVTDYQHETRKRLFK